jgi:hypothetical protein
MVVMEIKQSKIDEYVSNYTAMGLSTVAIDFEKAKATVEKVYECAGLKAPGKIVYCSSPMGAITAINILKSVKSLDEVIEYMMADTGLPKATIRLLFTDVNTLEGTKFCNIIRTSFEKFAHMKVSEKHLDFYCEGISGYHDADFAAFYEFFRKELGYVVETEKGVGLFEAVRTCGWVYTFEDIALISDRPCKLYRDSTGRLHSDDCAAVEYRDGYKQYFWHGTPVPEYVILSPEKITLEDILTETNQEIRRVKIQKFGLGNLISCGNAILIDSDVEFGELYHTSNLKDIDGKPFAFIKVIDATPEEDGTREVYALRVNPDILKVSEAWRSTFSKIPNFSPSKET